MAVPGCGLRTTAYPATCEPSTTRAGLLSWPAWRLPLPGQMYPHTHQKDAREACHSGDRDRPAARRGLGVPGGRRAQPGMAAQHGLVPLDHEPADPGRVAVRAGGTVPREGGPNLLRGERAGTGAARHDLVPPWFLVPADDHASARSDRCGALPGG